MLPELLFNTGSGLFVYTIDLKRQMGVLGNKKSLTGSDRSLR